MKVGCSEGVKVGCSEGKVGGWVSQGGSEGWMQ